MSKVEAQHLRCLGEAPAPDAPVTSRDEVQGAQPASKPASGAEVTLEVEARASATFYKHVHTKHASCTRRMKSPASPYVRI